jgi:hypothetical protein
MERSIYEPLIKGEDTIFTPEQRLWISVVMQSAIDAASTNKKVKREVFQWLSSDDFEIVCGMAGMSPVQVSHDISAILAADTQKEAFRKAMNFRFLIRSYIETNMGEMGKDGELTEPDPE